MTENRKSKIGNRTAALLLLAAISAGAQTAAPPSDVYLYRLTRPQDGVINITKREGYDNQPAFVGPKLVWTSQLDGQFDIQQIDFETGAISPLTKTPESEYSAARTPDGKGIAVIRVEKDSTQRLWRFPLDGRGEPSLVLTDIKPVGYFAYLDPTTVALFVLGSPNTLQIADTRTGKGTVVTTGIGRSLQRVPGTRKVSFTKRDSTKTWLMTADATPRADGTFKIDTIAALPDSADYVVWRSTDNVITGAGSRLMHMRLPEKDWITLADLSAHGIRRISRLAFSADGQRIAFVADEPVKQ